MNFEYPTNIKTTCPSKKNDPHFCFSVALVVMNQPANAVDMRDTGSIAGLGRFPRGRHSNPLQYSCLENPVDRGAWRATGSWGSTESDPTVAA